MMAQVQIFNFYYEDNMESTKFSVFDAIVYGLRATLDHFRLFFLAGVIVVAIVLFDGAAILMALGASFVNTFATGMQLLQGCEGTSCATAVQTVFASFQVIHLIPFILVLLVVLLIMTGILAGYTKMALQLHDTGDSHVSNLFEHFRLAPKVFAAGFLYWFMVFATIPLFFLGLYLGFRFFFATYLIIDKNRGIIEAFKESWALTSHQGWGFFSLLLFVGLLSMSVLRILMMPISTMSYVSVYRKLAGR